MIMLEGFALLKKPLEKHSGGKNTGKIYQKICEFYVFGRYSDGAPEDDTNGSTPTTKKHKIEKTS